MKRWFTLLLVLALCCAPILGAVNALADEESVELEEASQFAEPAEEQEAELEAEEDPTPEVPVVAPEEEAEEAFRPFYVKVLAQALEVYAQWGDEAPRAVLVQGDVLLAVAPAGEGEPQAVAFNAGEAGIVTGYAAGEALEALTFGELEVYENTFEANPVALYNDDINLPLAILEGRLVEEEPTAVETEEPEPTEVASDPTEEPTEVATVTPQPAAPTAVPTTAPTAVPTPVPTPVPTAAPAAQPAPTDGGEYAVAASEGAVDPTDFTLPATLSLGVKESYALLTPALVPANATTTFTWTSSKPKIVAVDPATGALLANKKGTAVITAKSANGITKTCKVTVLKAPKKIELNATKVVLMGGGQTRQLTATLTKKTAATVYYESSNTAIATVSPSGLITTVSPGTATVTARIFNGKTATCTVKVLDPTVPQPARVELPATVTIGVKQAVKLTPVMYSNTNENLGTTEFTVTSSAPKKLKVAADGTITGVKKGDYTVTVEAYNGITGTCKVHVDKAPSKVALAPKNPVVGVGQTRQLTVSFPKGGTGSVSFTSANTGVLTVDGNGYVKGISVGSAVVTARTHNGKTAKVTVKVTKSPEYVGLNAEYGLEYDQLSNTYTTMYNVSLKPGESFQLSCEVEYGAYGDVSGYESKDTSIATVTAGGLITAVAAGETTVVVRTTGGSETLCRVKVSGGAAATLWYDAAELTLTAGQTAAVPALKSSSLDAATLATATYASDKPAAFTAAYSEANARWEVTGVAAGTGYLTATVGEEKAQLKVTVVPAAPTATTPTYRLFAAYGYFNPDYKGYIPFTENNAKGMETAFSQSSISGLTYTTKVMGNPTKTRLLSGISSFFAGTADVDVSIVFLCSHGHMTNGYGGYRMSLPGYDDSPNNANYYMSSQEIFNCVSRIRGNVVLVVDSCYSGAFLQDMSGQLAAQGGRIAVLTAASDTRATYYNVKKTEKTVDFFTFFLLKGLGYNNRDRWWNSNAAGKRGTYPGYLAADQAGNKDGIVTLGEFYNYGAQSIAANIPSYMKKSWYWGDKTRVQVPRFYAGNLTDLVIYKAK